ncbi:MAG: sensor histidine kinase [Comamonas sp.]|nr:sensor histidine kinase [Comamonas sp.]
MNSLRLRLALWLLLPLSLFVALSAFLSWRNDAAVADYVQDHDLLASAKVLSDRLIWEGDAVQASVPPSALSLFASPERDRVYLSVSDAHGRLLAGVPDFPLPAVPRPEGPDRAQWYDALYRGDRLRAVLVTRAMYDVAGAREIHITVAKTTLSRDEMLARLWRPTLRNLLAALALTLALSALALTLELRPLVRLSQQLAARDPLHLDLHVDGQALHSELRPVADTINRSTQMLAAHSAAQRRFIADAAHQLRTPLALQASLIEYAQASAPEERSNADARLWRELSASNHRLVAVSNQLLLLAQAEHADAQTQLVPLSLRAAALDAVAQLSHLAEQRRIDLGLDAPGTDDETRVPAEAALLHALIANLIDNALRYTPEGGHVTVGVRRTATPGHAEEIELTVTDDGPGIPAEARERVFERFYRISPHVSEGTGLGLAIVREAARAFGARVTLAGNAQAGHGLVVRVGFGVASTN